jgi:hypothetical protein
MRECQLCDCRRWRAIAPAASGAAVLLLRRRHETIVAAVTDA